MTYEPIAFAALPGWELDDHDAALRAFRNSFDHLRKSFPALAAPSTATSPRAYFEEHFQAHRILPEKSGSLFTGYYEPVLKGSRTRSSAYEIPLLNRPDDLVTVIDDSLRASAGTALTHALQTPDGPKPYATRQEIEQGHLDGRNLEFVFLKDPVEAYFLHIQGSGLIELDDGNRIRVSYAAKNGHPYTSIGKILTDRGDISAKDMSLQALSVWLRADTGRARRLMWQNKSYIFFHELGDATATSATGVHGIPLTPDRSLAVDADCHPIGLPVFLNITDAPGTSPAADFRRLMVAQDVGSAIRGTARGDIFYGTGPRAGEKAGLTKHPGDMYVLLPHNVEAE